MVFFPMERDDSQLKNHAMMPAGRQRAASAHSKRTRERSAASGCE